VRKGYVPDSPAAPAQVAIQAGKRSKPTSEKQKREQLLAALDETSRARFERLRRVRLELAQKQGFSAFIIVSDRVLREIARSAPASINDLLKIDGVSPGKRFSMQLLPASGGTPNIRSPRNYPTLDKIGRTWGTFRQPSGVPDITIEKQEAIRARNGTTLCFRQQEQKVARLRLP
jgi:hypothetical protein